MSETGDKPRPDSPLRLFLSFPFESDETFQAGLASILAANDGQTDQEKENTLLRSQIFYFNRVTGHSLTVEEVRAATAVSETATISDVQEEVTTLTFAQIKELIEQGKTDMIPNNKQIPDALNEAPPSQSTASQRKKPWEV